MYAIPNPSVKTSIAVGGWNLGSAPFTRMVATAASRQEFATSTVKFLRDHNFDGLDLDWEYPANRGSRQHVSYYSSMIKSNYFNSAQKP
jgi:chitinase